MASVQAAGAPASHPYTCNSCQVAYRNLDLQKTHMKSDWQYVKTASETSVYARH